MSICKVLMCLLVVFVANGSAFSQDLQVTPQGVHDAIWTRSDTQLSSDLPKRMDLRKYLPQPGKQESQNDCVAWALGYSSYTCQISQERRRSPQAECDKFSPAFIYKSVQRDGKGLLPLDAIRFVQTTGCASMATMPQNASGVTSAAQIEAATFRAVDYEKVTSLAGIKSCIYEGYPVMLIVFLDPKFMSHDPDPAPYRWSGTKSNGLHAISAVGYDDEKQAILIMNSSGPGWKDKGFCWVSYDNLKSIDKSKWCVEAHVIKVRGSLPLTVRMAGRYGKSFQLKGDQKIYEISNNTAISPADWEIEDIVCAQNGLFALRSNQTIALLKDGSTPQNREWLHLDFGKLQTEIVTMLAADPSGTLHVLTNDGDVFEYRQAGDAPGVWQQINPPATDMAKTIDLRMAGMEVRATNEQGQVYVYHDQSGWTLAD